jgi:hypothetical protein
MAILNTTFDIINGTEKAEYVEFSPQLVVNMFMVTHPEAIVKKALFPTPGLNLENGIHFNLGGENIGGRATYFLKDKGYAVVKDTIYLINSTLIGENARVTSVVIGKINTETGYVGIIDNGTEIMFVDGVDGWILNTNTSLFTQISFGFPISPSDVAILGNRFIVINKDTRLLYYSAQNDGLSWNALDFFQMETTDIAVAVRVLGGKLYIIGKKVTEPWYDAGTFPLPYAPQQPFFDIGTVSPGCVVNKFGILVWLSRTDSGIGSVVATTGGIPQKISNDSIDTAFDSYSDVSDAQAYFYRNEIGHTMYVINLTIANASWMRDFNTQKWFKLESEGRNRHLGNAYLYLNSKHYVLDYEEPKMYEMSIEYGDDAGKTIERRIVSQNFLFDNPVSLNELKLFLRQGTGTATGNDSDPKVEFRMSWDGGFSYGNELSAPIGKIGKKLQDTEFYSLGISDSYVFEIIHYNKTTLIFLGAKGNLGGMA